MSDEQQVDPELPAVVPSFGKGKEIERLTKENRKLREMYEERDRELQAIRTRAKRYIEECLDFIEQVARWGTGPIRAACNVLLDRHHRAPVPMSEPMVILKAEKVSTGISHSIR